MAADRGSMPGAFFPSLPVKPRQALMFIDALYEKWNVERQGGEFWTLDSWQECHRIG